MTPFQITSPGIYRTRDGREAKVYFEADERHKYGWIGSVKGHTRAWSNEGSLSSGYSEDLDLVERIGDLPCICGMPEEIRLLKEENDALKRENFYLVKGVHIDSPCSCQKSDPRSRFIEQIADKEINKILAVLPPEPKVDGHDPVAGDVVKAIPSGRNLDRAYWLRMFAMAAMQGHLGSVEARNIWDDPQHLAVVSLRKAEALMSELEERESK